MMYYSYYLPENNSSHNSQDDAHRSEQDGHIDNANTDRGTEEDKM